MVDTLPGGCAHRDVAREAYRTVLETLADVDDLAVGLRVGMGVWALQWRVGDILDDDKRVLAVETGLPTELFVALALRVEAIGGEGVAIGADGTPFVVVASHGP